MIMPFYYRALWWATVCWISPWSSQLIALEKTTQNALSGNSNIVATDAVLGRIQQAKDFIKHKDDLAALQRIRHDVPSDVTGADAIQLVAADLIRVSISARDTGDKETSFAAADLALKQLAEAAQQLKGNDAALADIHTTRGFIREYLSGDSLQALQEYKQAAIFAPESQPIKKKLRQLTP